MNEERRAFLRRQLPAALTWSLLFGWLWPRVWFLSEDGLFARGAGMWGDMSVHLSYAAVFAWRDPAHWLAENPLLADAPFRYPFAVDGFSGLLLRAGWGLDSAFTVPSFALSVVLMLVLCGFYARRLKSAGQVMTASALLLLSGGMYVLEWARDFLRSPSLAALLDPGWGPSTMDGRGLEWPNVIAHELLPQRAFLVGLPLGLFALDQLARWRRREEAIGLIGIPRHHVIGLGLATGLLAILHMHSLLAMAILCAALLFADVQRTRASRLAWEQAIHAGAAELGPRPPDLRRVVGSWLVYAAAVGAVALPWSLGVYGGGGLVHLRPGWLFMSHGHGPIAWLWLNFGVGLPLVGWALWRERRGLDPLLLGGLWIWGACALISFQPSAWDNTKLMTWAWLLLVMPITRLLAALWRAGAVQRGLAIGLFVLATASGTLDVLSLATGDDPLRMWSPAEIELGETLRAASAGEDRVLCAPHHHAWVPALAGRKVVMGYDGWLWSYGLDYAQQRADVGTMLRGGPEAERLMAQYGIRWVSIGPAERREWEADEDWFAARYELLTRGGGHRVYRVP